jgi:hypothetical protein
LAVAVTVNGREQVPTYANKLKIIIAVTLSSVTFPPAPIVAVPDAAPV